ncbi:MAG TPA: DsbA family oxidoreductase [Gemmatimonadaceae bacterium]|nr:DsbA family oxidoreductase [Gemmatimonadaceae bacterium]
MMKVEIWSDIACPWCYVGKRRFEAALREFEHADHVEVVWRSFELDPNAPRTHAESQDELLAKKYGMSLERAREMNARMTGEAAKEGLEFHFERVKVGNTFDAHRLVHLAAASGKADAMKERLMRAYLTDGDALGETETLRRLGAEVGLDAARVEELLASDAFAADVRADEARARAFGISGVPFFAIDERYGVSGAQTPEVLLGAMRQAYEESAATRSF